MNWTRALVIAVGLAPLASAQAPQFRILDNPLPVHPDAVGDLDGDGDPDVLDQSGVYLNDGHGRFTGPLATSLAFPRRRTVLADFDGNGFIDVLSIDVFFLVRLDLNLGGLAFAGPVAGLPPIVPSPAVPWALVAGDVDLDGDIDVLIGTRRPTPVYVPDHPALWKNDGAAGFTPAPASVPAADLPANQLLLRDLDNNGYLDAIFVGSLTPSAPPSITCALNTGGSFALSPSHQWFTGSKEIAVADFDGDGRLDIASAGFGVAFNYNSPAGFTGFTTPASQQWVMGIRAIDVHGDGISELAVHLYESGMTLHSVIAGTLGPSIQFWPLSGIYSVLPNLNQPYLTESVIDLDGDGDRDLFGVEGGSPALFMNTSQGTLVRVGGHAAGLTIWSPLPGDVDGDGHPDVMGITVAGGAGFVTGVNDGDGYFHNATSSTLPGMNASYSLYPFDRDGDGDSDLYAASNVITQGATPIDYVFDNVNGGFASVANIPGPGFTVAFQAFDFDGDGDQDIVLGRRGSNWTSNGITGPMRYLQNDGAAGFSQGMNVGGNHATLDLDLGDFDGNGTTDVFQTNAVAGILEPCVAYVNPGNAAFVGVTQNFSGIYTATGDLNNDGFTDLVVDGQVYLCAGGGTFVPGPALPSPLGSPGVLADVDLDGDLDLVETPATIMFNLGGANFGPPISILPRVISNATNFEVPKSFVRDVDLDGDPDIVAPGPIVLSNVARQIARGSLPRPGRPASIDLYGTPGGPWALFAATQQAWTVIPPFGNVLLDLSYTLPGGAGTFGAAGSPLAGSASVSVTVPNNSALIGYTTYWQAVDLAALKTTNRLTITVIGF